MHLRDFVRASKANIRIGSWHYGKVPRGTFALARKAYRLGNSFEWCVVTFDALGRNCRVLVVLNPAKQKFEAIFGVETDEDLKVLCSYEFHATEPGWHCHACCDELDTVPTGLMRGPWVKRLPGARRTHRRQNFGVDSRTEAIRAAIDCYRIAEKGSLL